MDYLPFVWTGAWPFAIEVAKPVKLVSLEFALHGRPVFVTLWRPDSTGLRVHSEMHDLTDRIEIGVLNFDPVASPSGSEEMLTIPAEFEQEIHASKLVINELRTSAESGIVLRASNANEITVIAGAYPYSLALKGVLQIPHIFEPEYPIEQNMRIPIR